VRPVEGIYQLMRLSNHLISLLSEIKSDVFVIQSNFDDIIDPKATEYFFRKIGTDRKTIEILNDNRVKHILTTDENPLKDEIFLKVYNWILGVI
jgi:esterase/lipase